ncbi:hypothetical protein evm_009010 [Chilo suppressalis]|nr:hypothetical protein evm_009010 [Chilo suppressalis]
MELLVILSLAALAVAAPHSSPQVQILDYEIENAGVGGNIHLVIRLSVPASVAAGAASQSAQHAQNFYHENVGVGYNHDRYAFETSNGISDQNQGEIRNKGRDDEGLTEPEYFSWVDPNGVEHKVKHAADEDGYQPEEDEGPGSPGPIVASLLG